MFRRGSSEASHRIDILPLQGAGDADSIFWALLTPGYHTLDQHQIETEQHALDCPPDYVIRSNVNSAKIGDKAISLFKAKFYINTQRNWSNSKLPYG